MKRIHFSIFIPYLLIFIIFIDDLHAVPGFARQTGLECMMCHASNQSNLNAYGRDFARSGYTMSTQSGPQSLIVGKDLGLSTVLNVSLMLKARYDKSVGAINGKGSISETADGEPIDSNRGMHEIFKTSTINIAGKIADNVGSVMELREKEGKTIFGGKVVSSFETGDAYSGFSVYSTNNYGPFTGMESYSTGLYKPLRQFENHKLTNAAQAADLATGAATGIQVFYAGENLFLTVGTYVPMHNTDGIDLGASMIPFARIAYEQPIGDMRLIIGAYGISGSTKISNTILDTELSGYVTRELIELKKEAYGVDLQLEGDIMSKHTLLTINAVLKNKTTLDKPYLMNYITPSPKKTIYGEPADADMEAYSIEFELYPTSSLGLKVSFLSLDDSGPHTFELDKVDAKDKDAYTFGFDYSFRQNVTFTMEYSMVKPTRIDIKDYTDLLSVLTISF
ncbi:hypothetical protein HUE87_03490 [Candidatus Sulfurimonas marisnigri]|uniref:Cytochrome c domain-containing protein n=1 Tax=Candidatus Sulfurimonas marisnigri TaxID=2740405 RepID=A0A7S7M1H2_9BACT|nr:hypothetical protein [Candidatus Sulfurimonas marisnigri]QOY55314.1 hypothetical protein HUE87_03490 [Candidatus Sulfurimonas marisnigri]